MPPWRAKKAAMKSILKVLFIGLLLLVAGLYFGVHYLFEKSAHQLADMLIQGAPKKDLKIKELHISRAGLKGWNRVGFDSVIMTATVNERQSITRRIAVSAAINNLSFSFEGMRQGQTMNIGIHMSDGKFETTVAGKGQYSIQVDDFSSEAPLDLNRLKSKAAAKSEIKKIFQLYLNFVDAGQTPMPLSFTANSSFALKGQQVSANFATKQENDISILTVRREDIAQIAKLFEGGMGEEEVDIITAHPTRAARLLHIKNDAQKISRSARGKHSGNPVDAYRHVTWSYLITKEYGADFAKLLTDAHETGSTTNSQGDHLMDYNNNYIGREYAQKNIPQNKILIRMLNDRRVVWSASQALARHLRSQGK